MKQEERLSTKKTSEQTAAKVNLPAEVILDEAIRPAGGRPVEQPSKVLLTGATGFLGAFLAHALVEQPGVDVYCLVRAADREIAVRRLRAALESYSLWDESTASRLHAIPGDIGMPLLGLSAPGFDALANEIDVIYHLGAMVNLVFPYTLLKPANVLGTREVLRLATRRRTKWVHHVSTNAIFLMAENGGKQVLEDDPLLNWQQLKYGYLQSKWVSEKLVTKARDRGVPVTIYRPAFIGWHSKTGVFNDKDLTCGILGGSLSMGVAPELDMAFNIAPVDYVTRTMLYLGRQLDSIGKAFNMGSHQQLQWNQVVEVCREAGVPLRQEPYARWRAQVEQQRDNPCYKFLSALPEVDPRTGEPGEFLLSNKYFPILGCQNVLAALSGTSITCPPLSADLLEPFMRRLRQVRQRGGAVAPPGRMAERWASR